MYEQYSELGRALLSKNLISELQLNGAIQVRNKTNGADLGDIIVHLGYVTEEEIAKTRADILNLPFVDVNRVMVNTGLLRFVNKEDMVKGEAMPIELRPNDRMLVAVASPSAALQLVNRLEAVSGKKVTLGIASRTAIIRRLNRLLGSD